MTGMRSVAVVVTVVLLGSCNAGNRSAEVDRSPRDGVDVPAAPCADATGETLMNITEHLEGLVSICRQDGQGDCLYTEALGKTFILSRPDFNGDERSDFLIKDFTGAYGNHDIVHHIGYVACPQGGYINVLDTFVTSVHVAQAQQGQWARVDVSRDCFDDQVQYLVSRRYTLSWDSSAVMYGPPNDDPELSSYCTEKEMDLPVPQ